MKRMAVLALASGAIAAPLLVVGSASATPLCEGPGCVPFVDHNAAVGEPCIFDYRYLYGVDSLTNSTLVCSSAAKWVASKPLLGVYTLGGPCAGLDGVAQSPDGLALACKNNGWVMDDSVFYHVID